MLDLSHYEMLDLAATHGSAAIDDLNRALALGSAYCHGIGRPIRFDCMFSFHVER